MQLVFKEFASVVKKLPSEPIWMLKQEGLIIILGHGYTEDKFALKDVIVDGEEHGNFTNFRAPFTIKNKRASGISGL